MSTKIHNAYKFDKKMTIQQVIEWAKPYRQKCQKYAKQYIVNKIFTQFVTDLDRLTLDLPILDLKRKNINGDYVQKLKTQLDKLDLYYLFTQYCDFYHNKNNYIHNEDLDPCFCVFQKGNTTAFMAFASHIIQDLNNDDKISHYVSCFDWCSANTQEFTVPIWHY